MKPGKRNSITDVTGLLVGQAEDRRAKTGVTVLTGTAPFTAAVHVMGGAPGTRETDLLAPDKLVDAVDALVLAGGSALGLEAASGVTDALIARGRGFPVQQFLVPIVPAAIILDLINGAPKDWIESPYRRLGAEALAAASGEVSEGTVGAGTGATTKRLKGGTGTASLVLDSGHTVGALAIVNARGAITVGQGPHFWAAPFEFGDEFGGLGPAPEYDPSEEAIAGKEFSKSPSPIESTTIAIVATDAKLSKAQAQRMAISAHDGLARSMVPAHTPFDGDLVFAAATGEKPLGDIPAQSEAALGHAAAVCLARAVARGVFHASPAEGDLLPTWRQKFGA